MNKTIKRTGLTLSVAILASGSVAAMPAVAAAQVPSDDSAARENAISEAAVTGATYEADLVQEDVVEGSFSFSQSVLTSNDVIANVFNKAANVVCGAAPYEPVEPGDWAIEVTGDVDSGFTATLGEMTSEEGSSTSQIMTCTCSNNLPGGGAIATAQVEGVGVDDLLVRSGAQSDVNTVTFTSADGSERSFSLDYVLSKNAVIASSINGAPVSETMGGSNQLWLEGAAGKYFLRDVVSVEFTAQEQAPEDPVMEASEYEYLNRPNVSAKLSA